MPNLEFQMSLIWKEFRTGKIPRWVKFALLFRPKRTAVDHYFTYEDGRKINVVLTTQELFGKFYIVKEEHKEIK